MQQQLQTDSMADYFNDLLEGVDSRSKCNALEKK
jgi:hypothetical protein